VAKPKKKRRHARRKERVTLASLLTEAFGEKVSGRRGIRPLSHYVADNLWERALLGRKNAYRDWQKFREFAQTFDDAPPTVIQIIGGRRHSSERGDGRKRGD
jgi:hypothetical protein